MAEYAVIDSDGHIREAIDELRGLLPQQWRQRGLSSGDTYDRSLGGTLGQRPRGPDDQLAAMDRDGVDVAVLYPTACLGVARIPDHPFAEAVARAYNDWTYSFCQVDPKRLKFAALISPQDVEASVRGIRHAAELKAVAIMLGTPVDRGQDWGDPSWDPIWTAAQEHDLGIAIHTGAVPGTAGVDRFSGFIGAHAVAHPFEQMIAVCGLVVGGVLEKFPRLRVAFLESGVGWLPYWLDRLDEEVEKRGAVEAPWLKAAPSEYVLSGRCFFGVECGEKTVADAVRSIGDECLLFSTDYPHWDGDWPRTVRIALTREDLSDSTKRKMLHDNALRFYGKDRLV
jgi:predicted TIM-barrel fold metal-dependent hydrolase